ncbi:MAG: geranylgeranyl reductase family protein [Candidatus Melainabacteria bacterium]|nr:geranylgeranyl reductase family protein [Candidatus Melainabacteria bacterium]
MTSTFDCIIVGSGPSGGAAAYHLTKLGHKVLIIEKEKLPRYKPCGGGVSPIISRWFDFDFTPVILQKVKTFRYTWCGEEPIDIGLELKEPLWMVKRNDFDFYIITQALKKGAKLFDETEVINVEFKDSWWTIKTNLHKIKALYLIACDGAKGRLANLLGFKDRKYTVGGAIEAEASVGIKNSFTAHFEFGMVKNGYLWNFPKIDGCSLGVGVFKNGANQDLKTIVSKYTSIFNIDFKTTQQYGHPLLLWNGNQKLHAENGRALLAGEAACLVDPLTAEGIRPSIFSGIKAAEAVSKALCGDASAIKKYTKIIHNELGRNMRIARRLSRFLYMFPDVCYKTILKRPSATNTMAKILCGEMDYKDLVPLSFFRFKS